MASIFTFQGTSRRGFVPLASMTIALQKTAINNFDDISRIFFFFLQGGAFWQTYRADFVQYPTGEWF